MSENFFMFCICFSSAIIVLFLADFPLNGMNKNCVKVFTTVLKECNSATLEHLLYFCINSMVSQGQGISSYGYKIFLQILARNYPDMVVSKLSTVQYENQDFRVFVGVKQRFEK